MCDWKGLLNWSLNYHDGTKPSEFKPMSEEDRKFIEAAFESVCLNEMKEIWKILDEIKIRESDMEESIQERCTQLELLSSYIDGPENARNIVRGKRFNEIISYFFETNHKKVKISLGRILAQMMQNDNYIQKAAMDMGIFQLLKDLNNETDQELITNYIYILTGIIYGNEVSVRKYFVKELDGMTLLYNLLLKQRMCFKNFRRIISITNDLTKIIDDNDSLESFNLRKDALEIIKQRNIHSFLIEMAKEYPYNKDEKNIDSIHLIFGLIANIAEIYDSFDVIKELIQIKNLNLKDTKELSEEQIKEEKSFLIDIMKTCRKNIELSKIEFKEKDHSNTESEMIGGKKDSMRIEIKK